MIGSDELNFKEEKDELCTSFMVELRLRSIHVVRNAEFQKEDEYTGRLKEFVNTKLTKMMERKLYGDIDKPLHELQRMLAFYLPSHEMQLAMKFIEEIRKSTQIQ